MSRKIADCRLYPSDINCSLTIAGEEEEVMQAAVQHAVARHGHTDSPELRSTLRTMLVDEVPQRVGPTPAAPQVEARH